MADQTPSNHWDSLASSLGAEPKPASPPPATPAPTDAADKSRTKELYASTPAAAPPKSEKTPPAKRSARHAAPGWSNLAKQFGLPELPEVPATPPAAKPPKPAAQPTPAAQPAPVSESKPGRESRPPREGNRFDKDRRDHRRDRNDKNKEERPSPITETVVSEAAVPIYPAAEPFQPVELDEVVSDFGVGVSPSASDRSDEREGSSEGGSDRKRRKRRRRPRRSRESDEPRDGVAAGGANDSFAELESEDAEDEPSGDNLFGVGIAPKSSDAQSGEKTESGEGPASDEEGGEKRKRRRRRRSGRKRRGETSAEGEHDGSEERGDENDLEHGGGEGSDADDDLDGESSGTKTLIAMHRGLPSWEEAVGVVIAANMDSRAKKPNAGPPSRPRGGRGRGGRDRSGPRKGPKGN